MTAVAAPTPSASRPKWTPITMAVAIEELQVSVVVLGGRVAALEEAAKPQPQPNPPQPSKHLQRGAR